MFLVAVVAGLGFGGLVQHRVALDMDLVAVGAGQFIARVRAGVPAGARCTVVASQAGLVALFERRRRVTLEGNDGRRLLVLGVQCPRPVAGFALQAAGADALELNTYFLATDPLEASEQIEKRIVEIGREVKKQVKIPVAMKLSPFYSSLPHLAQELDQVGLDGLVLFNRFYQPDIDLETLEVLRQRGSTSELSANQTVRRLLAIVNKPGRFVRLCRMAASEPPRVRAMLGAIGQQLRRSPRELTRLRSTLNPLSKFDFGKLAALKHAAEWQARLERARASVSTS